MLFNIADKRPKASYPLLCSSAQHLILYTAIKSTCMKYLEYFDNNCMLPFLLFVINIQGDLSKASVFYQYTKILSGFFFH